MPHHLSNDFVKGHKTDEQTKIILIIRFSSVKKEPGLFS